MSIVTSHKKVTSMLSFIVICQMGVKILIEIRPIGLPLILSYIFFCCGFGCVIDSISFDYVLLEDVYSGLIDDQI